MIRWITFLCLMPCLAGATEAGDTAPAFNLPVLSQSGNARSTAEATSAESAPPESISLEAYQGKVRYIDFWASWCAPCRVSFPDIIALHNEFAGDRFEVIAISVDEQEGAAHRFLRRFTPDYPVLHDATGETAARYGLPGMPTSFVVDQAGTITLVHTGYRQGDMDKIRTHVRGLLEPGDQTE